MHAMSLDCFASSSSPSHGAAPEPEPMPISPRSERAGACSRAGGFPSPDSGYAVRFVYVQRRDWYRSLTPGHDVIEAPIEDDINLNVWNIRKALRLLLKSNAVVSEWISSPIRRPFGL